MTRMDYPAAKDQLEGAYRRFLEEQEPARQIEAGRDLIRTIFGENSIAENSIP